jgi:dinuclear metal center YbgI/SA1388 family protein
MAVKCREICTRMEEFAPPALAMDFDNVGLLVGDPDDDIDCVLAALEVTHEVIDEAKREGAQMILTHHPLMLSPLKRITAGRGDGALVHRLAREGLNFYAAHTNLDVADGGVNDALAQALGLKNIGPLEPYYQKGWRKLVTFVPASHAQAVRDALFAAGAGRIGAYGKCSFSAAGMGTFEAPEGGRPFIGRPGQYEEAGELRVETVLPAYLLSRAVDALIKAHPYEEPAWDAYALEGCPPGHSLGRVGDLEAPLALNAFAARAARLLECDGARVLGDGGTEVTRVAVCGGSGSGLTDAAAARGAQALLTGELKHHECLYAKELGLAVVLCGHFATERVVLPAVIGRLQRALDAVQYSVRFVLSKHSNELRMILGE